jgi:hypothetical protein
MMISGAAMGDGQAQGRRRDRLGGAPQPAGDGDYTDVAALAAENAQLRELVIALSRLVLRNVVDRK